MSVDTCSPGSCGTNHYCHDTSGNCTQCNVACTNCTGPLSTDCISCSDGYFTSVTENGTRITDCLSGCPASPSLHFINYNTTSCDDCSSQFQYCNDDDCDTYNKTISLSSQCIQWCGTELPLIYPVERAATYCSGKKCKPNAVLMEECSCCIRRCPDEYEDNGGKCKKAKKAVDLWMTYMLPVFVVIGVVVAVFVVVVVFCLVRAKRRKDKSGAKPAPLPHKDDVKRPLTSITTNGDHRRENLAPTRKPSVKIVDNRVRWCYRILFEPYVAFVFTSVWSPPENTQILREFDTGYWIVNKYSKLGQSVLHSSSMVLHVSVSVCTLGGFHKSQHPCDSWGTYDAPNTRLSEWRSHRGNKE